MHSAISSGEPVCLCSRYRVVTLASPQKQKPNGSSSVPTVDESYIVLCRKPCALGASTEQRECADHRTADHECGAQVEALAAFAGVTEDTKASNVLNQKKRPRPEHIQNAQRTKKKAPPKKKK